MTPRTVSNRLALAAGGTPLGSFAMVMATGITAIELRLAGQAQLAAGILVLAVTSFVVLSAATCWRLARLPVTVRAELTAPDRAFTAFAIPAACCVLCSGLVAAGYAKVAAALAGLAVAAWLILTVLVPVRLAGRRRAVGVANVNGSWFLWAVSTQSLAIAAAALASGGILPAALAAAAGRGLWLAGMVIYLATLAAVGGRIATRGLGPVGTRAPYWVAMGAASISVLAAAAVLRVPGQPVPAGARAAVSDATLALWVLASALIPVLVAATVVIWLWQRPRPLRVSCPPVVWTIAFPAGMYATASMRFGTRFGRPSVHDVGAIATGPAIAIWTAAFVALVIVLAGAVLGVIRHRRGPGAEREPARRAAGPPDRRRYKCEALIQLLPAADDGAEAPAEAVYRAVVYARHHGTGASELFSSQVTIDDAPPRPDLSVLVTVEAFGREPGDCLAPGDLFTIWRGRDLARGVVTRRIFV